jgi:hypothetical protein
VSRRVGVIATDQACATSMTRTRETAEESGHQNFNEAVIEGYFDVLKKQSGVSISRLESCWISDLLS